MASFQRALSVNRAWLTLLFLLWKKLKNLKIQPNTWENYCILYYKTNKETSNLLCSVAKHTESSRALQKQEKILDRTEHRRGFFIDIIRALNTGLISSQPCIVPNTPKEKHGGVFQYTSFPGNIAGELECVSAEFSVISFLSCLLITFLIVCKEIIFKTNSYFGPFQLQ